MYFNSKNMRTHSSKSENPWAIFFIFPSGEDAILTAGASEEDNLVPTDDDKQRPVEGLPQSAEDLVKGAVDPARTRAVDPARTRVDPARTRR